MANNFRKSFLFFSLLSLMLLSLHSALHAENDGHSPAVEPNDCELCTQLDEAITAEHLLIPHISWGRVSEERKSSPSLLSFFRIFHARAPPN